VRYFLYAGLEVQILNRIILKTSKCGVTALGIRYGFVLTYGETVLLKIGPRTNDFYALFYSELKKHITVVIASSNEAKVLFSMSVRVSIVYLWRRAVYKDDLSWFLKSNDIDYDKWATKEQTSFQPISRSNDQRK
jgi:hypothetical protein